MLRQINLSLTPVVSRLTALWALTLISIVGWAQPTPPGDLYLAELRGWLKSNWYDAEHDALGYLSLIHI